MKVKIQKWQGVFILSAVILGLALLVWGSEYRFAHFPERSAIIPRGMPQSGQMVQGLAISPTGKVLVCADVQLGMSLWNMPQLVCERRFENSVGDSVSSIYWTPVGNKVVLGDFHNVHRWDVHSGWFAEMPTKQISITRIPPKNKFWNGYQLHNVSPSGNLAAGFEAEGNVSVWNIPAGRSLFRLDAPPIDADGYPVDFCDVAFSPDDRYVSTTSLMGDNSVAYAPLEIALRDSQTGSLIRKWQWKNINITKIDDSSGGNLGQTGLTFSTDGKLLATADSNSVALWEMQTGKLRQTLVFSVPYNGIGFGGCKRLVFFDANHLLVGVGWGRRCPNLECRNGSIGTSFSS